MCITLKLAVAVATWVAHENESGRSKSGRGKALHQSGRGGEKDREKDREKKREKDRDHGGENMMIEPDRSTLTQTWIELQPQRNSQSYT